MNEGFPLKYARISGGVGWVEQGVGIVMVVVVVMVDTHVAGVPGPLCATPSAFGLGVDVVQVPNASMDIVVSPMYRELNLSKRDCLLRMRFLSIFSALLSRLCWVMEMGELAKVESLTFGEG
jgi:hypothetical protein